MDMVNSNSASPQYSLPSADRYRLYLGLNLYGCYRKTQVHFIFIILFLLGCLATFTLATAKLMLLGKIEGSVDLLSIAFAVQALTFLSALLASRSLMENTVTIFEEKEADMAVNEWDPKL